MPTKNHVRAAASLAAVLAFTLIATAWGTTVTSFLTSRDLRACSGW
jgi:hypothetical protein